MKRNQNNNSSKQEKNCGNKNCNDKENHGYNGGEKNND